MTGIIRVLALVTSFTAPAAIAEESTIDLGEVLGEAKGIWSLSEAGCRLLKTGEFDRLSRAEASKFGILRLDARSLEWMSSAASCSYAGYEFYPKPGILIYGLCEFRGTESRDLIELEPKRDGAITLRFRNGFWNQGKPAKYVRCPDRCASMVCNTASAPPSETRTPPPDAAMSCALEDGPAGRFVGCQIHKPLTIQTVTLDDNRCTDPARFVEAILGAIRSKGGDGSKFATLSYLPGKRSFIDWRNTYASGDYAMIPLDGACRVKSWDVVTDQGTWKWKATSR